MKKPTPKTTKAKRATANQEDAGIFPSESLGPNSFKRKKMSADKAAATITRIAYELLRGIKKTRVCADLIFKIEAMQIRRMHNFIH